MDRRPARRRPAPERGGRSLAGSARGRVRANRAAAFRRPVDAAQQPRPHDEQPPRRHDARRAVHRLPAVARPRAMTIPRDALIAEAERIGRSLLQAAVREDGLLSWWTLAGAGRTRSESLYSGAAGIALFFMRLAEVTGSDEYLAPATSAMRWTESSLRQGAALSNGFYNGRLGIAYAWLRLSSIDGR